MTRLQGWLQGRLQERLQERLQDGCQNRFHSQKLAIALLVSLGLTPWVSITPLIAQEPDPVVMIDPLSAELDTALLEPDATLPTDGSVIRSDTISQSSLTPPSLWWAQEQFGGKLINNWLAYRGTDGNSRRVDLVVNQQVWSLYTYFERYGFVTQMGTAAWDYGFNTRVFNRDRELLAAYICQPGTATTGVTEPTPAPPCELTFYICESLETLISQTPTNTPQRIDYCREAEEFGGAPRDPNPLVGR